MDKNFLNIVPQEVIADGERKLRYKGRDGKFHGIESGEGGEKLSVEEVTQSYEVRFSSNSSVNMNIADFVMRFCASKVVNLEVISTRYQNTSISKLYFDNSIVGPMPYYYNLTTARIVFQDSNGQIIDEIDRETFTTDMEAAKYFFNRTLAMVMDLMTPYRAFYFMLKSNFINVAFRLTLKEYHLVGTAKDGTKADYGILHTMYGAIDSIITPLHSNNTNL